MINECGSNKRNYYWHLQLHSTLSSNLKRLMLKWKRRKINQHTRCLMQSHWTVSKYRNAETSKISQSEAFANYHVTYYVHHWNLWHWLKENDQRRGVYLCRNDTYFVISSACEKTFTTFSLLVSIRKYHMQCLHTGFFKDVYLGNYKWRLASTLDLTPILVGPQMTLLCTIISRSTCLLISAQSLSWKMPMISFFIACLPICFRTSSMSCPVSKCLMFMTNCIKTILPKNLRSQMRNGRGSLPPPA